MLGFLVANTNVTNRSSGFGSLGRHEISASCVVRLKRTLLDFVEHIDDPSEGATEGIPGVR
jgi:hypothetical protein